MWLFYYLFVFVIIQCVNNIPAILQYRVLVTDVYTNTNAHFRVTILIKNWIYTLFDYLNHRSCAIYRIYTRQI